MAESGLRRTAFANRWKKLRRKLSAAGIWPAASILDSYVSDPPSFQAAFDIFRGEWSSDVPGYGGGSARLFDDHRVRWFAEQCGGFKGKTVLELGPLEGGHTSMIANAGAAQVTSIESNTRAFLKCLVAQNALKFSADFLLGDFCKYLDQCDRKFDLLVASGVLYHMSDPVGLLKSAAKVSDRICLWTHYYDESVIRARRGLSKRFSLEPRVEMVGSRQIISYRQSYLSALDWKGFCGGPAPTSYWLTRDSLLGLLEELGFVVVIGDDTKTHPNGSSMTLYAARA